MQSSEIYDIIQKFPSINQNFLGVYSINTIPKKINKNHFLISNTSKDTETGQHWFCILKTSNKTYEYFDSLGIDSNKIDKLKFYKIFKLQSSVKFNETAVQQPHSSTCGYFVLYFIIHRMHNLDLSFNEVLDEIFVLNKEENETNVMKFASSNF